VGDKPLLPDEFVISADEKTSSIQARCRCHPTLPPAVARVMRVEHEYERCGALQYLAGWDVHRAKVFGRCEEHTGIEALRPAGGPRDGRRALRLGSESVLGGGQRLVAPGRGIRPPLGGPVPNLRLVHCPVHSSWLNQVEIYFSVVQRKVLTPNDFVDLGEVERRLLAFERRYEEAARPFEWTFTRAASPGSRVCRASRLNSAFTGTGSGSGRRPVTVVPGQVSVPEWASVHLWAGSMVLSTLLDRGAGHLSRAHPVPGPPRPRRARDAGRRIVPG